MIEQLTCALVVFLLLTVIAAIFIIGTTRGSRP